MPARLTAALLVALALLAWELPDAPVCLEHDHLVTAHPEDAGDVVALAPERTCELVLFRVGLWVPPPDRERPGARSPCLPLAPKHDPPSAA